MRIRAFAVALLLALSPAAFHTELADAQPAKDDPFTDMARQRFQEGVKLFDQGKYEEARAAFLQAYALKKHPAVLLNLAQSELRSNHPVEAARHFSVYLRENPNIDAAERKVAQDGLTAARARTARLDIRVNVPGADVFVDDELLGRSPLPEPVDTLAGARKVEVKMPGYRAVTLSPTARVGKVETVNVSLESESGAPVPVLGTAPSGDSSNPDEPSPATSPDDGVSLSTEGRKPFLKWVRDDKVAWATGGATVVGLGFGLIFTLAANKASSNAENIASQISDRANADPGLDNYLGFNRHANPCASPIPWTKDNPTTPAAEGANYAPACQQLQDNLDARDTDRTLSYVGWGLAGAGAVATGVMYFVRTKPGDTSSTATNANTTVVTPVMAPGIQGLMVGGTF